LCDPRSATGRSFLPSVDQQKLPGPVQQDNHRLALFELKPLTFDAVFLSEHVVMLSSLINILRIDQSAQKPITRRANGY